MITAAEAVFAAMANVQTIEPIVQGYQTAILAKHRFAPDPELTRFASEIILDPKEAFLLKDADFKVYNAECLAERDRLGLKVDKPEFCPLLVAEDLQRKAEHWLVEAMKPVTGLDLDRLLCAGVEELKKYIDLALRLLAPFVRSAPEILAKFRCTR